MSNWGIVALENIANELKNIREILEKQYRAEGEWISGSAIITTTEEDKE